MTSSLSNQSESDLQTKTLHIVRHGKALQSSGSISDIDRPLAEKGILNNIMMAKRLKSHYSVPDLIISSPAERALHTAHIFARLLEYSSAKVQVDDTLYMKGEDAMLEIIENLPDEINSVMLVGHNPDQSYLAGMFLPSIINIPTSGVVSVHFETNHWDAIGHANAKGKVDYPKE